MMMFRRFLALVLLIPLIYGVAGCDNQPSPPPLVGIQVGRNPDTENPRFAYYALVSDQELAATPEWDGAGPAPLPLPELSKRVLASFQPAPSQPQSGWEIDAITFRHFNWYGNEQAKARRNKWYVEFNLYAPAATGNESWKYHTDIYTLLDGTIIKPQRAPAPPDAYWLKDLKP